jgi:hypothetical protein
MTVGVWTGHEPVVPQQTELQRAKAEYDAAWAASARAEERYFLNALRLDIPRCTVHRLLVEMVKADAERNAAFARWQSAFDAHLPALLDEELSL